MNKKIIRTASQTELRFASYGSSAVASLPGPENIFRKSLANGITVLARSNFASPSVVINGYFNAGSIFEKDEKLGMADFTAAALMRGTLSRPFQQIYETIESIGASLGFSSGTHTTGFSGRALVDDLPVLLELCADCVINPEFPNSQVERLRSQLLTALAIRAQDTSDMASMLFDKIIFAGHPYARPDDGYPETIQNITRDDLAEFHRRHYGPAGMVIAIVGAVEPQRAFEHVEKYFGNWVNPLQPQQPALPPVSPLPATTRRHASIPGKAQNDIYIGAVGPTRTSPDYLPASLGNSILGQFGMMGRIGNVVREQSGLAYYAYSSLSAGIGPGAWEVSAGVNPANVDKAIDLIVSEIKRFVSEKVSDEELIDTKANFIGRLPLSLESNMGVANALISIERYQLGMNYYRDYARRVEAVTADEVLAAANTYLDPNRLAIATAGA